MAFSHAWRYSLCILRYFLCLGANFCVCLFSELKTHWSPRVWLDCFQGFWLKTTLGLAKWSGPRDTERDVKRKQQQQQQQKIQCKEQDVEVKQGQNSADMRREGWENWAKGDGICAEWRDAAKRIKSRWSENKHVGKRQRRRCWKQIGLSMLLRTGCKAETGRGKPPQQNKWRRGNGFSLWCEWTRESAWSEECFVVLLRCVLFRASLHRKKALWWHFLSRIPSSTTNAYVNTGCSCRQLTLGWTPLKLLLNKTMSCPYSNLWQPWGKIGRASCRERV